MIIVRHGEIFTKSEPVRRQFIRKLVNNIRIALPTSKILSKRWRILIYPKNEKKAIETLKRVFGIVSFSVVEECNADMKKIKKNVKGFLPKIKGKKFSVRTQRLTKKFPLNSAEVNSEIGSYVLSKVKAKVNLSKPDIVLNIEISGDKAYVFTNKNTYKGPGGLPLGSARGVVSCDFKNKKDMIAAWMVMKRGACVVPVHSKLERWAYGVLKKGEVLGKVSGVTDFKKFMAEQEKLDMPLFAPLVGFNNKEINCLKRKIF